VNVQRGCRDEGGWILRLRLRMTWLGRLRKQPTVMLVVGIKIGTSNKMTEQATQVTQAIPAGLVKQALATISVTQINVGGNNLILCSKSAKEGV